MTINWLTFVLIAALSFGGTEVIKSIVNLFKPEWRLGLVISVIFSLAFVVGLGTGLIGWIAEFDYESAMIPILFQVADLVSTALILSLGSKGLNKFIEENLGIDISGSVKRKDEARIRELQEP